MRRGSAVGAPGVGDGSCEGSCGERWTSAHPYVASSEVGDGRHRHARLGRRYREVMNTQQDDPRTMALDQWLASRGTSTGTFTINGVTYTDMNEVHWRRANNDWTTPRRDGGR
jgi:hypothetical protein